MSNHDQLAMLAELAAHLDAENVAYWLFGGWAVDFHVGHLTREHADIDIAIWERDHARLTEILETGAWRHQPDPDEDGYTCYQREHVRLEVAFLARDATGEIYTPIRNGRGEWPNGSFGDDVGRIGSVTARVVSRESLIADKSIARSDAVTSEKDRVDAANLRRSSPQLN